MRKLVHKMLCAAAIVLTVSLLSCQKDESDPNPPQTQEAPTIAIEVTATEATMPSTRSPWSTPNRPTS